MMFVGEYSSCRPNRKRNRKNISTRPRNEKMMGSPAHSFTHSFVLDLRRKKEREREKERRERGEHSRQRDTKS